jgi:hypothetical protein
MKPSLEFRIGLGTKILLFFGIFAIIGASLALVKQFLHVAREGMVYFSGD